MANPIIDVPVLLTDLELLRATLNSALNQNVVLDLAEQYRKLSNRPQSSPMTKAIQGSIEKVEAYINSIEEDEDEHVS